MIEDRFIELIQKVIAGLASPEEQDEFEAYIQENEEARNLCRQLAETSRLLDEVPPVKPSVGLKKRIMDSMDFRRYAPSPAPARRPPFFRWIFTPKLRLAYAFALGVLIGFLTYSQFVSDVTPVYVADGRQPYGTAGLTTAESSIEVGSVQVDRAEAVGTLRLWRFEYLLIVESDLTTEGDVEIHIEYAAALMDFAGFESPDVTTGSIEIRESLLKAPAAGRARYVFSTSREPPLEARIEISVVSVGNTIFRHEFEIQHRNQ
jgi:hypothetical protein